MSRTLRALAAMICALALAGCATSLFSARASQPTATQTVRAAARTVTTPATTTLPSPPKVTTVPTTTPAGTTLPGYKHPVVQLGDMNTDEQFILGELYDLALKQQGYTVVLSRNIGTTEVSQAALQQGSLMLYPEYLDVWNQDVAQNTTRFKSLHAAYHAAESYAAKRHWVLLSPTPFSDTSGIAVSAQYARLNHIHSLAQLGSGAAITLGAPLEFAQARTGLPDLEAAYGFKPAYVRSINIGDQYHGLSNGTIQATYVTTTDPQLTRSKYVLLRDPKHAFGFGNVVPVTTSKVVSAEGPAFVDAIDQVDQLLTNSAIRGLNYEVTIEHHDPAAVARQFLAGNGVLPAAHYQPVLSKTSTTSAGAVTGTTPGAVTTAASPAGG